MIAVDLGQQGSQAVGSGFESLPCQIFFTIYPQYFSIPKISDTLKGCPTIFFGTVRQEIFDGKSWHPPPPPSHPNFFDTRKWWKTKGFPYGVVRHCEAKNFRLKSWYFPLPLIHILFRYQKFSGTQHRRVPIRNVSVLSHKNFRRKIVT